MFLEPLGTHTCASNKDVELKQKCVIKYGKIMKSFWQQKKIILVEHDVASWLFR